MEVRRGRGERDDEQRSYEEHLVEQVALGLSPARRAEVGNKLLTSLPGARASGQNKAGNRTFLEEPPYDVFVSYSSRDRVWVLERLLPALKQAKLKVCIDHEAFDVGVPVIRNIENAAHASRRLIVVLSPAWVESKYAEFEGLCVRADDLNALNRRILPALIEPCGVPEYIGQLVCADFVGDEFEVALAKLVRAAKGETTLPSPMPRLKVLEGGRARSNSSLRPHVAQARAKGPAKPFSLKPLAAVGALATALAVFVIPRVFPTLTRAVEKEAPARPGEELVLCALAREASPTSSGIMKAVRERLHQKLPRSSRILEVTGRCSGEDEAKHVAETKGAHALVWTAEAGPAAQLWMLTTAGIRQDVITSDWMSGVDVGSAPADALPLGMPSDPSTAELECAALQAEAIVLSATAPPTEAMAAAKRAMTCMRENGARIDGRQQSYLFYAYLAAWAGGEHTAAVDALSEALTIERTPEALNNRGVQWIRLGKLEAAAKDFSDALAIRPTYAAALSNRGNVYRLLGDMDRATADLQAALALEPSSSTIIVNLGVLDYQLSRFNSSKARLAQAAAVDPKSAMVRNIRGLLLLDSGELAAAQEEFECARRLEPRSAAVLNNLANVEDELGRFVTALQYYDEALAINPRSAAVVSNRAATLVHLDRTEEAKSEYRRAIEMDPTNIVPLFNLALLNEDLALRRAELGRVLEIEPTFVVAYAPLIEATAATDAATAKQLAARALELPAFSKPASRELLLARADVLAASGQSEAALRDYDDLLSSSENDGKARCARAKALYRLGRTDAARRELERLGGTRPECSALRVELSSPIKKAGTAHPR